MLEKILKFLPIYQALHALKYFVVLLQSPFSYIRTLYVKPSLIEINEYSKHKFIFIYASIESTISESSLHVINKVKSLGGYIILITNSSKYNFNEKARQAADVFIDNKDTGWDFSEYKIASNYVYKNLSKKNFIKIIYANDSVFYLPNKLEQDLSLLLNDQYDVISFFDGVGRYNYHFGSWLISISKDIFMDPKIIKFWNKFFEVKNKFYAVMQGEFSFSKTLLSLNPKISVVYNDLYINSLKELNMKNIKYISSKLSEDFFESRNFHYGHNDENDNPLRDYIAHNLLDYPKPQALCPLLAKYYDLSFVKKDLYWHESQSMNSIHLMFSILDEKLNKNYADTIKAYFLKRGRISNAKYYFKLLGFLGIR